MANYHAVAVTGLALRGLLSNAWPRDQFPGAEFRLFQTKDLQTPLQLNTGVSVYLHRIAFNTTRRNLPFRQTVNGKRYRPPTPVDLHFLITAWGRSAEEQLALLGWAIRTLEDTPVLSAGLLNRFAGDWGEVFDKTETVELVGDVLSLQDSFNIWEIAKHNHQPSVSYVARMIRLDSEVELTEAGPVQTRAFDYTRVGAP
jgi:Pvc16 N-terminal domain